MRWAFRRYSSTCHELPLEPKTSPDVSPRPPPPLLPTTRHNKSGKGAGKPGRE
jgi:hypothetical protein